MSTVKHETDEPESEGITRAEARLYAWTIAGWLFIVVAFGGVVPV